MTSPHASPPGSQGAEASAGPYLSSPTDSRSQAATSTSHVADVGSVDTDHGAPLPPTTTSNPLWPSIDTQPSATVMRGLTGPVGEPGLPPSRQSSRSTKRSSRNAYVPGVSRHGSGRTGRGVGGVGGGMSIAGSDRRPPTASSRTHVPLTSHAFFRPMSSQRLQAQRGPRPNSLLGQQSLWSEKDSDSRSNVNRRSDLSNLTVRENGGIATLMAADASGQPPPSRGTDYTNPEFTLDRTTANSTPTGAAETVRSRGESITPLQPTQQNQKPEHQRRPSRLDLDAAMKAMSNALPTPTKSPRSFRSSFILPNRGSHRTSTPRLQVHESGQGAHEKLESGASTPRLESMEHDLDLEGQKTMVKKQLAKGMGRNWEYWTGNTVFCWGGRLQNSRDRPINVLTGLLIIIPSALFFGFSAPYLWHNVSPAIPLLFAYTFYICISSFLHASLTDPGILPRNLHPFPPASADEDPLTVGPPTTEWTLVKSELGGTTAMEVPTKYCKSCNIWRPPRCHHCRVCDNCVEAQDHHCVWLNNCVGRRNYRYFFAFIASGTVLGLFLMAASLAHVLVFWHRDVVDGKRSFGRAINTKHRVPFAMAIYGFVIFTYPAMLWGYHLFLTARGETTHEFLNSKKFLKKDRHRPFTRGRGFRGAVRNWTAILIRPRPPTYLNFKQRYIEGDQRFGEHRGKRTAPLVKEQQGGGMEMSNMRGFQGPSTRQGAPGTAGGGGAPGPLANNATPREGVGA